MKNLINARSSVLGVLLLGISSSISADWLQDVKDKVTTAWQNVKETFTKDPSAFITQLKSQKDELLAKLRNATGQQKQQILSQLMMLRRQAENAIAEKRAELQQKFNSLTPQEREELNKTINSLKVQVDSFKAQLGV